MKIYLAGPMRGIPYLNFPAFHEWAAKLRKRGHTVFSPAENDIERLGGRDVSGLFPTGDAEEYEAKFRITIRSCLENDLAWICREAEAVALLPGWEKSLGVKAEIATALALGIEILELGDDRTYETSP